VLKWIVERCMGRANAIDTALGRAPAFEDLDLGGMHDMNRERFTKLMSLDADLWRKELQDHDKLFDDLKDKLPGALKTQRDALAKSFG
jgi:phosphoenolpyruvate carboxykinase (GTP)